MRANVSRVRWMLPWVLALAGCGSVQERAPSVVAHTADPDSLEALCRELLVKGGSCVGDTPAPYEVICVDYREPHTPWSLAYRLEEHDRDAAIAACERACEGTRACSKTHCAEQFGRYAIKPISRLTNDVERVTTIVWSTHDVQSTTTLSDLGTPNRRRPLPPASPLATIVKSAGNDPPRTTDDIVSCRQHGALEGPSTLLTVTGTQNTAELMRAVSEHTTTKFDVRAQTIESKTVQVPVPQTTSVAPPKFELPMRVVRAYTTAMRAGIGLIFQKEDRFRADKVNATTWRAERERRTEAKTELFVGLSTFGQLRAEDETNYAGLFLGLGLVSADDLKINSALSFYAGLDWVLAGDVSVIFAVNARNQAVQRARPNEALSSETIPTEDALVPGFAVLLSLPFLSGVKF